MEREVDLDEIMLTPEAVAAWHQCAADAAKRQRNMRGRVVPSIPDERACVSADGTLTIFVDIPGILRVSLRVSAAHWRYRAMANG